MKKIATTLAFFFFSYGFSQTGINYQAIIKNSSGNVYSNSTMVVTFSLRYDTSGGSVIYSETHNATSTSEGQISLVVGTGNKTSSGVDFSAINFSRSIFYTTEVNIGGAGNVSLGTQQLRSVSSAYFAKNAAAISPDNNNNIVIGTTISNSVSSTELVAIGINALQANTIGASNTAIGYSALQANTVGSYNVGLGSNALQNNTTGILNTAIGFMANRQNTTGILNTAIGSNALDRNTTGSQNTAIGFSALSANTTGTQNVAVGINTAARNIGGIYNVALGNESMLNNLYGSGNTAVGYKSLFSSQNNANLTAIGYEALLSTVNGTYGITAVGYRSMYTNTTGWNSTALGFQSLYSNTTGADNVSLGTENLRNNITGSANTSIGSFALYDNTVGYDNTSLGYVTLKNNVLGDNNTAVGSRAGEDLNTDSNNNTFIGSGADTSSGTTINNSTALGANAQITQSNTIQLGNTSVTSVQTSGVVSATGFETTGTVTATSFVGDGSGLTNLPSSSLNASTTARLSEIFIQPHEVTTNTSVSYPPGYSINLIPFPEGTGTVMGGVLIPLMMPSNWNRGNLTVTFYYSCSAADGNIRFNTGARRYGTGDVNITYPVSPFFLTPSAAWTLNKHTYTQSVGDYNANSVDDSLLIINFSRYAYQPQNYGDTNTGDMYIHGIRIAYSTN